MATQLGNVTKNYGQQHNNTVTNLNGETILNSDNLRENTTIIAAPSTVNKTDLGTYAVFVTDADGKAVRLTYTMQPGNGLVVGRDGHSETSGDGLDVLSMAIDGWSIQDSSVDYSKKNPADSNVIDEGLFINKQNIIDNKTLMVVTPNEDVDRIKVITENLDHATTISYGITKGDENTVLTNDGLLSVNTQNLDYADDLSLTNGIVAVSLDETRTISAANGTLNVITYNLAPATDALLGVVKPDNSYTFVTTDGTLEIRNYTYAYGSLTPLVNEETEEIVYIKNTVHGIVAPDMVTTYTNNGVLSISTSGLAHASESDYGTVKCDGVSTGISSYGLLEVKQYGKLQHIIDEFDARWTYILGKLVDLESRVTVLETTATPEHIDLDVDSLMMSTLQLPVWDNDTRTVVSPVENISVELRVSTNCPFKVSVDYDDNVNPPIVLTKIKFGSDQVVTAAGLIDAQFDSTNDTINQLKLSFECSNYSSDTIETIMQTVATIKVTSINDAAVYRKCIHTFVRHNCKRYEEMYAAEHPRLEDLPQSTPMVLSYINNIDLKSDKAVTNSVIRNTQGTLDIALDIDGYYTYTAYSLEHIEGESVEVNAPVKTSIGRIAYNDNLNTINVNIKYGYTYTTYVNSYLETHWSYAYENSANAGWARYSLLSTYNNSEDNLTHIKVTTNKITDSNRTAYITINPIHFEEGKEVAPICVKYTEQMVEAQPIIKCVVENSNVSASNHSAIITVSKDVYSTPKYPRGNWGVHVGLAFVNKNGILVDSNNQAITNNSYMWYEVGNDSFVISKDGAGALISKPKLSQSYTVNYNDTYLDENITGVKVVSAYTHSFKYVGDADFTYLSRNKWVQLVTNDNNFTFGNAVLNQVDIKQWDDVGMEVKFTIIPGTTTNIPVGSDVFNLTKTAAGNEAFKFVIGNSTYDWKRFYDNCEFSATPWSAAGCTVTYKFSNTLIGDNHKFSIMKGRNIGTAILAESSASNPFYSLADTKFSHEYDSDLTTMVNNSHAALYPVLKSFTYFRFWFALYAKCNVGTASRNTILNFEVSNTGTTYKYSTGSDILCYKGSSKVVDIENSVYAIKSTSTSGLTSVKSAKQLVENTNSIK